MKEETNWKVIAGIILVTVSLALYTVHYLLFFDAHHILIFLVSDIAFIPLEVLAVTLIIDRMLEARERKQRMEKLNMVIGTFFSALGTPLLAMLARADPELKAIGPVPAGAGTAVNEQFVQVKSCLAGNQCRVVAERLDLVALRDLLNHNEEFLLRIIENPMVFEHESFTDLILAVTHLGEELRARESLVSLPPSDIAHLEGDIHRVYTRAVPAWIGYMEYLRTTYPYLFSLALRKNPFDPAASVVVR